ncbi:MAG: hypothetical protein OXD49_20150 [Candidatus Poribacteria bacterium]|nr:hypothetical protein [Candidatus Poribacteria bacterium]
MKPLLCVVDTNSLIHMRDIRVARRYLGLWLWREFTVGVSDKIIEEVQKQRKYHPSHHIQRKCTKSKWAFQNQIDKLENVFLRPFYPNMEGDKDKGELHNCCVALEAILNDKHRQIIFLTDELHSTNPCKKGFIYCIFDTYPIGKIWSSLDFILYLFLRHRKNFSLPEAENVLRDVNSRIGGKVEDAQKRLTTFNQKLRQIDLTLSQLRSL